MDVDEDERRSADRVAELKAEFERIVSQGTAAMAAAHGYVRSDPVSGARLSAEDEHKLQHMLLERVFTKRLRDFQAADALRARLKEAGVHLNDGEKTYSIRPPQARAPTHHGYTRADDGRVVLSPADQATLDQMLLQRLIAKRARDFELADNLRKQLREAGVLLDDANNTYCVVVREPRAPAVPTHHGYTRAVDSVVEFSPSDQATLDALLLERMRAKRIRDFGKADELQRQLTAAGVIVDDTAKTYRLVPPPSAAPPARPREPSLPTEHGYTRAEEDDGEAWRAFSADQQATIERLLLERTIAKRTRQFDLADSLRAQLGEAGVIVDDKARAFRVIVKRSVNKEDPSRSSAGSGNASGGKAGGADDAPWTRDPLDDSGVELGEVDQAMLVSKLNDRRAAQKVRDFAAADAIRDELRAVARGCGCMLFFDDKAKTYRFAAAPSQSTGPAAPAAQQAPQSRTSAPSDHGYTRKRDDGMSEREVSDDEQRTIDRLLLERIAAKRSRDFDLADELRTQLSAMGCFVDDKAHTYSIRPLRPAGPPTFNRDPDDDSGVELAADQLELLHRLLGERWHAQRDRSYALADEIRRDLRNELNVIINVRAQTWKVIPPRHKSMSVRKSPDASTSRGWSTGSPLQDAGCSTPAAPGRETIVPSVKTPEGGSTLRPRSPESYRESAHNPAERSALMFSKKRERDGLGSAVDATREEGGEKGRRLFGREDELSTGQTRSARDGVDGDGPPTASRPRLSTDGCGDDGGNSEDEDNIVSKILYDDI